MSELMGEKREVEESPDSVINNGLEGQQNLIDQAHVLFNSLETRLHRIINHPEPSPMSGADVQPIEHVTRINLSEALQRHNNEINRLNDRMRTMLDRLEL